MTKKFVIVDTRKEVKQCMARPPQVTRHITFTQCLCTVLNKKTGEVKTGVPFDLQRIVKSRNRMLEKCRKLYENDEQYIVSIDSYRYMQAFALQTEIEFLHKASKILSLTELDNSEIYMAQEEENNA